MEQENLELIYAQLGGDETFGSLENLRVALDTSQETRQLVYDQMGGDEMFGSMGDFQTAVGIRKTDSEPQQTQAPDDVEEFLSFRAQREADKRGVVPFLRDAWRLGVSQGRVGNLMEFANGDFERLRDLPEDQLSFLASEMAKQQAISEDMASYTEEGSWGRFGMDLLSTLVTSPVSTTTEMLQDTDALKVVAGSTATGAAVAAAGGPTSIGGAGAGFFRGLFLAGAQSGADVESGSIGTDRIWQYGAEHGLDPTDVDDLRQILSDDQFIDDTKRDANIGAAIIGTVDLATGGLASKVGLSDFAIATTKDVVKDIFRRNTVEAVGEGFGELAKQAVIEDEINYRDVVLEALGGTTGSALQTGALKGLDVVKSKGSLSAAFRNTNVRQNASRDAIIDSFATDEVEGFREGIDHAAESGVVAPEQAEALKQDYERVEKAFSSLPKEIQSDNPVLAREAVQNILDRDRVDAKITKLQQEVESMDEGMQGPRKEALESWRKQREVINRRLDQIAGGGYSQSLDDYDATNRVLNEMQESGRTSARVPRTQVYVENGQIQVQNPAYADAATKVGQALNLPVNVVGQTQETTTPQTPETQAQDNTQTGQVGSSQLTQQDATQQIQTARQRTLTNEQLVAQVNELVADKEGITAEVVTNEEFERRTGQKNKAGSYDPKSGTILINQDKANDSTALHEVAHAEILRKLEGDDTLATQMHQSLNKSLEKGSAFEKQLNQFVQSKAKGKRDRLDIPAHEYLAEMSAILATNKQTLDQRPTLAQNVIKAINDAIEKITGLRPIKDTADVNEAIDFVNELTTRLGGTPTAAQPAQATEATGRQPGQSLKDFFFSDADVNTAYNSNRGGSRKFTDAQKKTFLEAMQRFLDRNPDVTPEDLYNDIKFNLTAKGVRKDEILNLPQQPRRENTRNSQFADKALDKVVKVLSEPNTIREERAERVIKDYMTAAKEQLGDTVEAEQHAYNELVKLLSNRNIRFDTLAVLGQKIVKRLNTAKNKRGLSTEQRNGYRDLANAALDSVTKLGNEIGQALQAFRVWRAMDADGWVYYSSKVLNGKIRNGIATAFEPQVKRMQRANNQAQDAAYIKLMKQYKDTLRTRDKDDLLLFSEADDADAPDNSKLIKALQERLGKDVNDATVLAEKIVRDYEKLIDAEFTKNLPFNSKNTKLNNIYKKVARKRRKYIPQNEIVEAIATEEGITLAQSKEVIANIEKWAADLDKLPEEADTLRDEINIEMLDLVYKAFGNGASRYITGSKDSLGWSLWYASLLSGLGTHMLNIGNNFFKGIADNLVGSAYVFREQMSLGRSVKESARISAANWAVLGQIMAAPFKVAGSKITKNPKTFSDVNAGRAYQEFGDILRFGKRRSDQASKFYDAGELERRFRELKQMDDLVTLIKDFRIKDVTKKLWRHAYLVARYVPRFMSAVDALFYYGSYYGRLRQGAAQIATDKGLKVGSKEWRRKISDITYGTLNKEAAYQQALDETAGKKKPSGKPFTEREIRRRQDEILEQWIERDYGDTYQQEAVRAGKNSTYTQEPSGWWGQMAADIRRAQQRRGLWPTFLRLVVPFTTTLANVINDQLDYTPLGLWRAAGKTRYGRQADAETRFNSGMKGIMGIITAATFIGLAEAFDSQEEDEEGFIRIHGNGPTNFQHKLDLMADGWIPNSIQVGGVYLSYKETPVGLIMGLFGNYYDKLRYKEQDEDEPQSWESQAFAAVTETILETPQVTLDMSFLSSASRMMEIMTSPGEELKVKLTKSFLGFGRPAIPSLYRQAYQAFDPTFYQAQTVQDYFLKTYALPMSHAPWKIEMGGGENKLGLKPYTTSRGQDVRFGGNKGETLPGPDILFKGAGLGRFISFNTSDHVIYNLLSSKNIEIPGIWKTTVDGENLRTSDPEMFNKLIKLRGEIIDAHLRKNVDRYSKMSKAEIEADLEPIVKGNSNKSALRRAKQRLGLID